MDYHIQTRVEPFRESHSQYISDLVNMMNELRHVPFAREINRQNLDRALNVAGLVKRGIRLLQVHVVVILDLLLRAEHIPSPPCRTGPAS